MSADQLFDIETVEALDVIAKHFDETPECIEQDGPAVAIYYHGGRCGTLLCARHVDTLKKNLADAAFGLKFFRCDDCGTSPIDPSTITVREV